MDYFIFAGIFITCLIGHIAEQRMGRKALGDGLILPRPRDWRETS